MKKLLTYFAVFALAVLILPVKWTNFKNFSYAEESQIKVSAKAAYLIDYKTKTPIIEQNQNEKLPIASMTKLATLAVIFEEIDKGRLSLDEEITVSENAAATEGSSAFLDAHSKYRVCDLIKTIVVVSANDSCVALAEKISGTEELFAKKMNDFAKSLNLKNTNFENSTGLPSGNHYSSAKDMAIIYMTICENPTYKEYAKIWMEDFIHPSGRKTGLVNTNRLIKTFAGCDSGKTGHTNEAKYCLTASATRSGTRLVGVVIGAEDSKTRFAEMTKMFNYGFANYQSKAVVSKDIPVANIKVSASQITTTNLYPKEDYYVFENKDIESKITTKIIAPEKITAPVLSNQAVAKLLVLDQNNIVIKEIDLVTNQDIDELTFGEIIGKIFNNY